MLKNNQFIMEIAETGPVLCLTPVTEVRFAYGLANGTIGIYEEGIRLWRVKVTKPFFRSVTYQLICLMIKRRLSSQNKIRLRCNGQEIPLLAAGATAA